MEFVRHLEDSERALKSMGTRHSARLDIENVIVMLMRKLPQERLKRMWAHKAGDLIKGKGLAQFDDFVNFLKKVAGRINRFGRELKSSSHDQKSHHRGKLDEQRKINANAIQNEFNKERGITRASCKCLQCLGPHGIWGCPTFKGLALKRL